MIENLKGIHETVNFKENTDLRLYNNDVFESYPPHWHTPIEIIMPLEGTYYVTCAGRIFNLRTDDILIVCPGVIHALVAPPVGLRVIFQAEFSMLHQIKDMESAITIISPAAYITPETFPETHAKIKALLLEIREEYMENAPFVNAAIYAKLLSIMSYVSRNYTETINCCDSGYAKQKEFTEKFLYICNYINEHCTEDLTLDGVAYLAGFSKYHFSRLFKQFTNVSFYKYLNQKRIATAERLLIDPELSITEVAMRSGFASMSTFIRMFRIVKDCTPKEFRNMYKR